MTIATEFYNLKAMRPDLAKQWHRLKNGHLTAQAVTPSSGKKVWWICTAGHEWQATVNTRSRGHGCPYCRGRLATKENNLQSVDLELARQWHPLKNGNLSPQDVTPRSGKKVWWTCKRNHEWQATIISRSLGRGCPYCSGRLATRENNLQSVNPALARQWHPTENSNLTPKDIAPHSNKKVWWICKSGHKWQATVNSRSNGLGCPYCSGRFATEETSLERINPFLCKEWHPTKNGSLTPRAVKPNSHKKIWWLCKHGHEWQTAVYIRSKNHGCPYCAKQKNTISDYLPNMA